MHSVQSVAGRGGAAACSTVRLAARCAPPPSPCTSPLYLALWVGPRVMPSPPASLPQSHPPSFSRTCQRRSVPFVACPPTPAVQDPYHDLGQAMGLSFSVPQGKQVLREAVCPPARHAPPLPVLRLQSGAIPAASCISMRRRRLPPPCAATAGAQQPEEHVQGAAAGPGLPWCVGGQPGWCFADRERRQRGRCAEWHAQPASAPACARTPSPPIPLSLASPPPPPCVFCCAQCPHMVTWKSGHTRGCCC